STSRTLCSSQSNSERVATMTVIGWIQILLFCAIVVAIVPFLGAYMTRVFNGERTFLSPVLRPVEAALYSLGGIDERREQHWMTYTGSMLFFHVGGFFILFALMRWQAGAAVHSAGPSGGGGGFSFHTRGCFLP